jgi:hypothetical protein
MNVGLGFNPAAFSRASMGPSQAQVQAQGTMTGASAAYGAQDKMTREKARESAMKAIGQVTSRKKVTDKAGVTKVTGAKKR